MADYTPEQQAELEKLAVEAGKTIDELMRPAVEAVQAAMGKYDGLVRRLNDHEFAGLWQVVQAERRIRLARLMVQNPLIMKAELERLQKQVIDDD